MTLEEQFLQRAMDEILYGSERLKYNSDGSSYTERISDMKHLLVDKLAQGILRDKELLMKFFEADNTIGAKIAEKVIADIKYQDLPYDTKKKIEGQIDKGLKIVTAEVALTVIKKND